VLVVKLSNFRYVQLFQRYLRSNSEVIRNHAKFCMFLTPDSLRHGGFLNLINKPQSDIDYMAWFHIDHLKQLRDLAVKKNISSNT